MARIGEFMEVGVDTLPTGFEGFFAPYPRGQEPQKGAAAQTETGVDGRPEFRAVGNDQFVVNQFYVEAWLEDARNNRVLKASHQATNRSANGGSSAPEKKSWVLQPFIEAERYYRGAAGPNAAKPTISKQRVAELFAHEMGHYRISRLVALDCFRTAQDWANSFRGTIAVGDAYFINLLKRFALIKDMLQYAYDIGTDGGSKQEKQTHWMTILNTAEDAAAGPEFTPHRLLNMFWPGIQCTVGLPRAGVSPADLRLSGEILKVNEPNISPELSLSLANLFRENYKREYDAMVDAAARP